MTAKMRSSGVLALALALQLVFSVVPADSKKINSVETVYISYPTAAARTQFLSMIQTMWMNELNQFQLVDLPKVEFVSEQKDVGHLPKSAGGTSANKVTYRVKGSTAMDFDLVKVRKEFQDMTLAGKMGPIAFKLARSKRQAGSTRVNSVETVYMAYLDPATRLQFLNQLQTVWMNELNQFQLVDNPKVTFVSEVKNVGTMPARLGGDPANKVTYRLTGSTALPFNLDTERTAFQEAAMAGNMGPIAFDIGLEDAAGPSAPTGTAATNGKPFSYDADIYLQYVRDAEKIPLLTQVQDVWKSVLADQGTPSNDLTITIVENTQPADTTNIHKITYRVTGTANYDDLLYFDSILDMVNGRIRDQQLPNIFFVLPGAPINIPSGRPDVGPTGPMTSKPFSFTGTVFLQYVQDSNKIPLLSQVTDIWRTILTAQGTPSGDLAITITDNRLTSQKNIHQITYRVSGTADYGDMSYFDTILSLVNESIENQRLPNIFVTLPGASNVPSVGPAPIPTSTTTIKPFSYTATIYLIFVRDYEKTPLLEQIVGIWKSVLSDQGSPASAVTITVNSDQPTGQTNIHKIIYRVTGTTSYADMSYFDTILAIVNDNIENQQLPNIFVNLPTGTIDGTPTARPVPFPSATATVKPFSYTATVYLLYTRDFEKTTLLEQIVGIWKSVLSDQGTPATAVAITVTGDQPSGQTNIHKITYRATGSASYDTLAYFDTIIAIVNDNIQSQQMKNIFVTLPGAGTTGITNGWNIKPSTNNGWAKNNDFTYSMALLMTYTSPQERDKLVQQVLRVWQDTLTRYNINSRDVAITVTEEKPTRYGLNTMQVTFTITVRNGGSIDSREANDLFVQLLTSRPIVSVDFVPLGETWNNVPKVDWSAQGKSDVDVSTTTMKPQPSWVKPQPQSAWVQPQPQPAWKPQPGAAWHPQAPPAWKPQPATWKPAPAIATTSAPINDEPMIDDWMMTTESTWNPQSPAPWKPSGPGQANVNKVDNKIKLDKSLIPSYQVAPTNIYLISDQFRLTANSDAERSSYMDQLDSAWQTAIGNTTEFVQLVLYRDDALPGQNSNTHDLGYVVVIVSSNANLDINPFKATFDRIKPRPPVGLVTFAADLVPSPYAFLVLRDTIPRAYSSNGDRDSFLAKLQQLYVEALGKDALTVALAVFDDDLLDRMLDVTSGSQIKDLHQLSYFVLIVSNRIMDEDDVQHRFQQYLISRAVSCLV